MLRFHQALTLLLSGAACLVTAATPRLLDCTLESQSIDDCDYKAYAGRVGAYLVLGIALGLFTLISCPFYYCFRYCCNCCGGRGATQGCCCGCGAAPAAYSTFDIIRPKIYVVAIVGLALGSSAWGYFATQQTTSGLRGMVKAVNNTPTLLYDKLTEIQNSLIVTTYDPNSDSTSTSNLFNGTDLQSQGEKLKKDLSDALSNNLGTADTYIGYFNTTLNVIFAIPMVMVLIAGLCAICNIRTCLPMLTVAFMFLMGFIMWTVHGIVNPLALVTGDLCAEVHGLKNNQKTILKPISQCDDAQFDSFTSSFTDIEINTASEACRQLSSLCYDSTQTAAQNIANGKVYDCKGGFSCSNVRFGDVVRILQSGMYTDSRVASVPNSADQGYVCNVHTSACTPQYCADECVVKSSGQRSSVGKLSKQMYVTFLSAQQVSTTLDTLGGQYGNCDSLMQLVLNPFDSGCTDMSTGALSLRDATGLSGVMTFGFIFVIIWGSKRFMSLAQDEDTKEYEMQPPPGAAQGAYPGATPGSPRKV